MSESEERFDLVRSDGGPLGRSKPRSEVHRDGDWHRAIHVWVYGVRSGDAFLLLQQRAFDKETMPGKLCATVGGHLSAGERVQDAVREVEEEIGVVGDLDSMTYCGVRVCASDTQPGILDRELQDVYLWRNDQPLSAYRPDPIEVHALIEVPLARLVALWVEERSTIQAADVLRSGDESLEQVDICVTDFADVLDRYSLRVAIAVERVLAGKLPVI